MVLLKKAMLPNQISLNLLQFGAKNLNKLTALSTNQMVVMRAPYTNLITHGPV